MPETGLRVWSPPPHESGPCRRACSSKLDVEHLLVSHGEPVHGRDDLVSALEREPWSSWHGA